MLRSLRLFVVMGEGEPQEESTLLVLLLLVLSTAAAVLLWWPSAARWFVLASGVEMASPPHGGQPAT